MDESNPKNAPSKSNKRASIKAIERYLDKEATLIHENLDELKSFLAEHAALAAEQPIKTDGKQVDDYYNSADDFFRQVALEKDGVMPLEAQWYETFILRKKSKKNSPPKQDKEES
jgi:hypothetical protein